jgi:hypothetical protein
MQLPNEIYLSIFALLERTDLKTSRIVSKTWCACASTLLFDQIYVSSAREDLEIFEAVAQHPLLSRCVRRLKYDATEFIEALTLRQYIAELWIQTGQYSSYGDSSSYQTNNHEVNEWVRSRMFENISLCEVLIRFRDSQLVRRGYQSYKEHAVFQQAALKSGQFLRRLTQGLQKLESLEAVALEGSWVYQYKTAELGKPCTGSYLARNWNSHYCKPRDWRWGEIFQIWSEDPEMWKSSPDGTQSYKIVITALAQAHCHIRSFIVGKDGGYRSLGLPPTLFDLSGQADCRQKELSTIGAKAFAKLESFVLGRLQNHVRYGKTGGRTPEKFDNIDGLPLILGLMDHLKHLELTLSRDPYKPPMFYSDIQTLPKAKVWQNLESLTLAYLSITAGGLVGLLLCQTPNIRHLKIAGIGLSEGSWEAVIEALSHSQQLDSFEMGLDGYLFHHGGEGFGADDYDTAIFRDLEKYVVWGGRHPCLEDHQPDSSAHEWLQEFDPTLRDHIVQSCMRCVLRKAHGVWRQ